MLRAVDLLKEGRSEELWQMCCGFLKLNVNEFMDIQKRLLVQQMEMLNNCALGDKIMRGAKPRTVEEFRQQVPLTTYKDYCPELLEKKEDALSEKPLLWAHSAGKSGEYPCKWVPMTSTFASELSKVLYGVGMISGCNYWGDSSNIPENIKVLHSVARKPYISGVFADLLTRQSSFKYMPSLEKADNLSFEERIKAGFQIAMSSGIDYFFGLSLVLLKVGEKMRDTSDKVDIRPYLGNPKAAWRLARGKFRSYIAGRTMLPRDLWSLKGIVGSGVDSSVYKDKIKSLWGRNPLDLYSCTEGGVIATQAWDYNGLTFIPQLNFLEFIPEDEQLKLQMDRTYNPKTLLLDEVKAGENYEIVISNFHGGVMTRYRIGDMVRITALSNEKLGINLPQMSFEQRVDDIIDFNVIRLTEKSIWQALEKSGVDYEDWLAIKVPGQQTLSLFLELKDGASVSGKEITANLYDKITKADDEFTSSLTHDDLMNMLGFEIEVKLLPRGTFSNYSARRQAEGADLAHFKPPHINPPANVFSILTAETEETIIVTKTGVKSAEKATAENVNIS